MMHQFHGDDALSRSAVFGWHRCFSQGRDSLEDDVLTDGPQTVRTERKIEDVPMLVSANRIQSVDDVTAALGVSHGTRYKILTYDLNLSHVTQQTVPRIVIQDQRDDCMTMTICGNLISSADDDSAFLNRIITGDETWCLLYDPQLKRHPPPEKRQYRQDRKIMTR